MPSDLTVKENVDLSGFTTMGVAALARYYIEVQSLSELKEAITFARAKEQKLLVLGGGSNLLFIDDFDGVIVRNLIKGIKLVEEDEDSVLLKVGAGEDWNEFVEYTVSEGYGGIENLSLIPGTVGAAPIQNIGAYGVELKDTFESLEALHIESGEKQNFDESQCSFGYRDSIFKRELKGKVIILSVTLRLNKSPKLNFEYEALKEKLNEKGIQNPSVIDISKAVIEVRQSKLPDPKEIGNTGSFFKNPEIETSEYDDLKLKYPTIPGYKVSDTITKVPAGWLIEQAGWKGMRFGDAGIHDKQALVLVNHGKATGEELWELAQKIQASVVEKFNIRLMPEVNIIHS
ncbi:MAG: UDP-N-acetylmuramate dehydrogenase [Balneolaceae bacterium]